MKRYSRSADPGRPLCVGLPSSWLAALAILAVFTLSTLVACRAYAGDVATAEALFSEGRKLFDEGSIAEACRKFDASQRLDPSPGTLLNLARCHETQGKTATAWAEYLAAKRAASAGGRREIAEAAAARAAELEPGLAHLTVQAASKIEGFEVIRSGVALEPAMLGTSLPVDPGVHRIVARAPGYQQWSTEVTVGRAESNTVQVPELVKSPVPGAAHGGFANETRGAAAGSPRPLLSPAPTSTAVPTMAYVAGGVGVATFAAGLVFGALAKDRYDDAQDECPTRTGCSAVAMERRDDADTFATVASIAVPVGLAAIGGGVALYVLSSTGAGEQPAVALHGAYCPGGTFGVVEGRF